MRLLREIVGITTLMVLIVVSMYVFIVSVMRIAGVVAAG